MYWLKVFKISKHKSLEFQVDGRDGPGDWFIFNLSTHSRCDHGGVRFEFSLLRLFYLGISFYDHRHWDYENDQYVDYSDLK